MCPENQHQYFFVELGGTNPEPPNQKWTKHGCLACIKCGNTKKIDDLAAE